MTAVTSGSRGQPWRPQTVSDGGRWIRGWGAAESASTIAGMHSLRTPRSECANRLGTVDPRAGRGSGPAPFCSGAGPTVMGSLTGGTPDGMGRPDRPGLDRPPSNRQLPVQPSSCTSVPSKPREDLDQGCDQRQVLFVAEVVTRSQSHRGPGCPMRRQAQPAVFRRACRRAPERCDRMRQARPAGRALGRPRRIARWGSAGACRDPANRWSADTEVSGGNSVAVWSGAVAAAVKHVVVPAPHPPEGSARSSWPGCGSDRSLRRSWRRG